MLSIRCKVCNKEMTSTNKIQCCGCPNMTTVREDRISAVDLSKVVLLNSENKVNNHGVLTNHDLEFQENRRKRQVRKLYFEER